MDHVNLRVWVSPIIPRTTEWTATTITTTGLTTLGYLPYYYPPTRGCHNKQIGKDPIRSNAKGGKVGWVSGGAAQPSTTTPARDPGGCPDRPATPNNNQSGSRSTLLPEVPRY